MAEEGKKSLVDSVLDEYLTLKSYNEKNELLRYIKVREKGFLYEGDTIEEFFERFSSPNYKKMERKDYFDAILNYSFELRKGVIIERLKAEENLT